MTSSSEAQDMNRLYKFTKILALKVAQIVVQSRQGKKIIQAKSPENNLPSCPSNTLQWFNLSVPDEPDVTCDTKHVLNGEVVTALSRVLCIEISLETTDGDEMVLEMWTVRMVPEVDTVTTSISAIYYRMSIMLKSTLSISRITPAYKMSRAQTSDSYKIYHKIYGGPPNTDLLGDHFKTIKVSELNTSIGAIIIEVLYRTNMTFISDNRQRLCDYKMINNTKGIMVKSDHFPIETPRKNEKRELDLNKPLTAGAFVDADMIKELHDTLIQQLPSEPPISWLLTEIEKVDEKNSLYSGKVDIPNPQPSGSSIASSSAPHLASKAIEMPQNRNDRYSSLMEFPFADGSPMTELATFYQECLQARSASDEWTEIVKEVTASTDSDSLSLQLKMFEEAVPEFDNMVASMFSNLEPGSDC